MTTLPALTLVGGDRSRLEALRTQYPMDDRAFDFLISSPPEVQHSVLNDFKPPQHPSDGDYSKIVTSFVNRVRAALGVTSSSPLVASTVQMAAAALPTTFVTSNTAAMHNALLAQQQQQVT